MATGVLFVMSAASGAGKTTLKDKVMSEFPNMRYSISATTRAPRAGEVDGVHYHFRTVPQFEAMIKAGQLVEWNQVHGNYYGTPKPFLDECIARGESLMLDLDVFGKTNFDKVYPKAVGILILPPDEATLEKRLRGRGTDSDEVIRLRLENAHKEMEYALQQGKFEHRIINGDLETAAAELRSILRQHMG